MGKNKLEPNTRKAAMIAGLGLLVMSILAIWADMATLERIFVPGDASATAANILTSISAFRAAILGLFLVLILDVLVAWALYTLLEPVDARQSLLAAWLRVVYAAVLGVALSALVVIAVLANRADSLAALIPAQLQAHISILVDAFHEIWGAGYIIFGAHLLILGILALKSDYVPKLLGALLAIAGAGYIGEYAGRLLSPDFNVPLSIAGWGELLFMFWLLWVGRSVLFSRKGT